MKNLTLNELGFNKDFYSEVTGKETIGRVTSVHKNKFQVLGELGEVLATLKQSVFYFDKSQPVPVVGDFVKLTISSYESAQIVQLLPRKTYMQRKDPDPSKDEQGIGANFDTVLICTSCNQDYNLNRLERYAAGVWSSGAIPVVVLTKTDLVEDVTVIQEEITNHLLGVEVVGTTILTSDGLDGLKPYLHAGKTCLLVGSSGVGKSSLLNALVKEEVMDTGAIRLDDDKGRHTTTVRKLFILPHGGLIIDTPGMRSFGLWDVEEGLHVLFDEIETLAHSCQFTNCQHDSEPNCRVKKAIADGTLSEEQLIKYRKFLREEAYSQRKKNWKEKRLKRKSRK